MKMPNLKGLEGGVSDIGGGRANHLGEDTVVISGKKGKTVEVKTGSTTVCPAPYHGQ